MLIFSLHLWIVCCHVLLGFDIFLEESMDVSLPLTLTPTLTFGLCKLMARDNEIKGFLY